MCGEKGVSFCISPYNSGSPPRVRGKDLPQLVKRQRIRITPACAGKRYRDLLRVRSWRDHPRVCGEKIRKGATADARRGSPPRVRGKGLAPRKTFYTHGITPACAGKSLGGIHLSIITGDHPRVCGEKADKVHASPVAQGSPPRVRGKGCARGIWPSMPGITPACAGKSATSS